MNRALFSLARLKEGWRTWWAAGLALTVAGMAFRIVEARALDSPTVTEWLEAGAAVFQPWLEKDGGVMGYACWWWREAEPGSWYWLLGTLAANGQWDPRLGSLGAAVVLALTVFGLARGVLHGVGPGAAWGLALAVLGAWCLPGIGHELAESWDGRAGWLWGLGLAHLAATWRWPRRPWGHLAGLAAALASPAGAASAFALFVWTWVEGRRRGESRPAATWTLVWNGLLVAGVVWRTLHAGNAAEILAPPGWREMLAVLLMTAPGIVLAARAPGGAGSGVVAFWVLLLGCLGGPHGSVVTALGVSFAFTVQAAIWVHAWSAAGSRGREGVAGWASAWGALFLPLVIAVNRDLPPPVEITQDAQRRAEAVRLYQAEGDLAVLAEGLKLTEARAERVSRWLADDRLERWLPSTIRAPLALWVEDGGNDVFAGNRVPALPGLPAGYAAIASANDGPEGEFASRDFETKFPFLQIHVAGRGKPGGTGLYLRTPSGAAIRPLQERFDATTHWRRINLPVPPGSVALVASDRSSDAWLAVAQPVEMGRGTWLAGKAADTWPFLAFGGLAVVALAFAGGAPEAWRSVSRSDAAAWRRPLRWAPWLALAAYGLVLSGFLDTHPAGADSAGYLANARMLRDGELTAPMRTVDGVDVSPRIYAPLGFVPREDGRLAPGYPSGLSLMIAGLATLLPFTWATGLTSWLHIVLGVWVVRLLARECGLTEPWSWLAALWVGFSPVYVFMGLQPMSDVPSLTWLSAALLFALKARSRLSWALACGVATSMTVLLRPANVLAFLPLVVLLGSWRAAALWIVGAVPGALWQLWYAWTLFGSPLATGYGDMSGAFGREWIAPTLRHFARELAVNFTPLVFLAAVAPFVGAALRRVRRALGLLVVLYLAFYSAYFFSHLAWGYMRFLLPVFPALAILALLVVKGWSDRRGFGMFSSNGGIRALVFSCALIVVIVASATMQGHRLLALHPADGNSRYTELSRWANEALPPAAAVFAFEASTALFHHTGLTVLRFDQVEKEDNRRVARRLLAQGRPVYAVIFHLAEQKEINASLPDGQWRKVHEIHHMEVRRLESLAGEAREN